MSDPRLDFSSLTPGARDRSPWWGVHASRYLFAERFVGGRLVLDIACGTGYGLPILRTSARAVVGVDADFEAVRTAARQKATSAMLGGDGTPLPFPHGAVEGVTSFETIQHLHERGRF